MAFVHLALFYQIDQQIERPRMVNHNPHTEKKEPSRKQHSMTLTSQLIKLTQKKCKIKLPKI